MTKIALIFSYDTSIKTWKKNGSFFREITPYIKMTKNKKISYRFYTYDSHKKNYIKFNNHKIEIFPIYEKFPFYKNKFLRFILSFIYPFFVKKYFLDIDIIKTNQMWGSWTGVILKFILKKPLIIRCGYEIYRNEIILKKNFFRKIFLKILSKISYYYSDKIIVTTNSIKNFICHNFEIKRKKIFIQKNWIDARKFYFQYKKKKLNSIYVGRLSVEKNLIDLIKIAKQVNIPLNIYGEGPQKKILKNIIGKKFKRKIIIKGNVQNNKLPSIYNKHAIFFLNSKAEGQPKSLLEAMSCGLIVIGKNSPGINEIIKNNKNGYLLNKNYSNLSKIFISLKGNHSKNYKMCTQARKYILDNHSLVKYMEIEEKIYKKVLNDQNI
jgi:glycosyltransferase involved in cell wall biosynthesis